MCYFLKQGGTFMAFKAAIRAGALKSISAGRGGIASAESHAKRLDPVAQGRVVRPSEPIAWCKAEGLTVSRVEEKGASPQDVVCGALDYVEAFKAHKRETGAGERKGAALAIEFKAVVSPDWLAETGDPRDPKNPRVQQLVTEAKEWAESWGGGGSVWAVRYDTDEKGAGVVDLFMSPVRQQRHKNGTAKAVISCRKAKEELLTTERALDASIKTSGAAMQSSWSRWCQQRLDARLERGQPKEESGREHVHADIYAKTAEEARSAALEAVEAEKQILMQEIQTQRQEALEEHSRLMGLAGTPEFRREADMEVFNNIERIVGDWRRLKFEREAFETKRDAVLDARTQEILTENEQLKNQVYRLSGSVRQLQRIRNIWQETVRVVTGPATAEGVLERVKSVWRRDKENPDRSADPELPKPRRPSSGPSM
jgi:hypothetical protein